MTGNNALVEGKNASVVRKWLGHDHIPQRFAGDVNRFAQATLSPFLNFHRPCLFATEHRDGNGRIRRKHLAADVMTPYARLRSLPDAEGFLKPASASPCSMPPPPRRPTSMPSAASRPSAASSSCASAPAWPPPAPPDDALRGPGIGEDRSPLGQGWRPRVTR